MDARKLQFLVSIVGSEGASALKKACDRSPAIESILVPRAVVAWLGLVSEFEGDLPGVPGVHVALQKSDETYSGSVTIGSTPYVLDKASVLHAGSAISVALGLDADQFDPDVRDLDLVRLGKSIDLLVKAHCASMQVEENEALEKAISAIPPGPEMKQGGTRAFDYSHVLTPLHRKAGYSINVTHNPDSGTVQAHLRHGGAEVGSLQGQHYKVPGADSTLAIETSDIAEPHRGKGLGTALYRTLLAHAHHNGIQTFTGGVHSTMASGVWKKLNRQGDVGGYEPSKTPYPKLASPTPGPDDNRMGPYGGTIKAEVPASTQKAEPPGPPHQAAGILPQAPVLPTMQVLRGPPATKKATKRPTLPQVPSKLPKTLRVSLAQSERPCGLCGDCQFTGGVFSGCACLRDLKKSIKSTPSGDGFILELGKGLDQEMLHVLLESLGDK